MVYIQAKTDKKDYAGNIIKKGIDLFVHENSVQDSALAINYMGGYKLDNDILRWFSIVHDLGKANPLFLSNMLGQTDARDVCCRHEISSILFIDIVPEEIRDTVALLVLSHHKSMDLNDERSLKYIVEELGGLTKKNKTLWNHIGGIEVWGQTVVSYLKCHYNIDAEIPSIGKCLDIINRYAYITLDKGWSQYRGLCMMADHIASAYEDDTERIITFEKLFKKPDISFYASKNEKYPLSLIDSDVSKNHTFCIAPCGCGKTNFILKRCQGRIFYMLPFQASINAMAKRIQGDIGDDFLVGIKHASYKALNFIDDNAKTLSNLFGLPVKVITPFQTMSILFRLKGYESVMMDMIGQDVILDEIHTYTGKNMRCVIELIKVLQGIGCHIHICTATMPTVLMDEIMSILGPENTQYTTLTKEEVATFNRHIVHTCEHFNIPEICERYRSGEKVLVVLNQIKRARKIYNRLKGILDSAYDKILLLHSQFERGQRAELESRLVNDFNKSSEPCIVVSTQVVEVSIDINFDVMYTDCADIMSLIQRFGRVNRQRKNIGIYKDVFVVNSNKDNAWLPYDATKCGATFDELSKINGQVLDENYIQTIIDNVHPTIEIPKFDIASPYDNGEWKTEMYCHRTNESIASNLEFDGYIVIRESMVGLYLENRDSAFEIPVSSHRKKDVEGFEQINPEKVGGKCVYIVPDKMYDFEYGLII